MWKGFKQKRRTRLSWRNRFTFVSWIQQIVSHYLDNCKISQISQCGKALRLWRITSCLCPGYSTLCAIISITARSVRYHNVKKHGAYDVIASCLCPGYSTFCAIISIIARSVRYHNVKKHGAYDVIASCLCPGYSTLCAIISIIVRSVRYHNVKKHGAYDVSLHVCVLDTAHCVPYISIIVRSVRYQNVKRHGAYNVSLQVCVLDTASKRVLIFHPLRRQQTFSQNGPAPDWQGVQRLVKDS